MWTPLSEIDPESHERFGYKAIRLLAPLKKGLPLPPSWLLSCRDLASLRADPERAVRAAGELLRLAPGVKNFLLRSSSPWEDRLDRSAAGLFRSIPSAANERSLAHALIEMAESTRDPRLATLLELPPEKVTLAVLAQEELEFRVWATVECDLRTADGPRMRVEGRVQSAERPLPLEFELSFADTAPAEKGEFLRAETLRPHRDSIEALLGLAQRAVEDEKGIWLLELGTSGRGPVLLQRRPVQELSPPRSGAAAQETRAWEDPPFRDFPLFATDTQKRWEHDAAHSPGPLCPLLAGIFVRWIQKKGEQHPTRLIHGRWYDEAEHEHAEQVEDGARTAQSLRLALRDWYERRLPQLERGLRELAEWYSPLPDPSSWPGFVKAWLAWQDRYFDGAASALRGLAAALADGLERSDQELPPLPATIADRREREMDEIAARFVEMDEEERERALEEFLARHGHVAPGPTDGRSVPWREDPAPLVAELERRADAMAAGRGPILDASSDERSGGSFELDAASPAQLAARAFAALEDDDDLLARVYALFRGCALDFQAWLAPEAESAEILEVLPDEFDDLLTRAPDQRGERFERARARGEALTARWQAEFARENALEEERIERGNILRGTALAAGSASGELCILPSAQSEGGPPPGAILVVPLVLPADAIVFSRCAALICESGAVLGHAAVLAREKKIPALVLPRACSSLARVARARVDGGRGEVEILSLHGEGGSQ